MPKSLYLIDGHAQIYRAYYAPFGVLSSPTGEPTRATYVFSQMLLTMLRDRKPEYMALTLDTSDETVFRKTIYPEYKAHRQPAPEDLPAQMNRIISIIEALGMPILRVPGFEADDIIATVVAHNRGKTPGKECSAPGLQIYIVSKDKDLDQLLDPCVSLYDPNKQEVISHDKLMELKGWTPQQAVEIQCLVGDSTDNVPGVPGIGPKTAAKLIQKYGTAQAVIENAASFTPKQRDNVLAFAPLLDRTRQLVTLRTDVPVELDIESADVRKLNWSAVRPIFQELGFRRLLEQIDTLERASDKSSATSGVAQTDSRAANSAAGPPTNRISTNRSTLSATGSLFVGDEVETTSTSGATEIQPAAAFVAPVRTQNPKWTELAKRLADPVRGKYELVNTPEQLDAFARDLAQQPQFAVDLETTGINPVDCDVVGLAFAWKSAEAYYVPVLDARGTPLPLDLVREKLGPILSNPKTLKVGQNLKYDMIALRQGGMSLAGPLFDTMIASFVLDSTRRTHGLDTLVLGLFGHTMIPITDLIGKRGDELRIDQVPVEHVCEYSCEDVDYTWRLKEFFEPQLAESGMQDLFYKTEMPLVSVLTEMEFNGIRVDADLLRRMGREMSTRTHEIVDEVCKIVDCKFNLDSPKQLAEVLFDRLKMRVIKRTKTARSTDAETLEMLAEETNHPALKLLLEYRELQKLLGTYVEALPKAVSRRTGRIHTNFSQTGAITGRLSSSDPNLQNIPVRTAIGREIRRAFVPRSTDELLIVADYSQIELRILAHFSHDEALIKAFADDLDIHAFVAAQVNNVPLDEVTKDMRSRAKAVNFGIIYGQTAFGLSRTTGMSQTESQAFINGYFQRYPRIRGFMDKIIADAGRDGFVTTILGRRREITGLDSKNRSMKSLGERLAVNTVVQGSAADMIKVAMNNLHTKIASEKLPLRMLLQVHDELVCEAPKNASEPMSRIVVDAMSQAIPLSVPVRVDVRCAENWLEGK